MKSLREWKRQKKPTFPVLAPLQHILFSKVDSKKCAKNPFGQYYALRSNKLTQSQNKTGKNAHNTYRYVVYVQLLPIQSYVFLGQFWVVFYVWKTLQKVNFFSLFPTRAWRKTACLCALNRPWYLVFRVRGGYSYRRRKVNMFCSI